MQKFRSSLESEWVSACPTYGQQDDAKDFYKDAFGRIEKHFKALEDVAKRFEEKWNGVFKGALAPKTIDELLDMNTWRLNSETLASIRMPAVIDGLWEKIDAYYDQSFENPIKKLEDEASDLEGERREQALRAAEHMRKRVEAAVRDRIKQFRNDVANSLRWFEPDEIKKTLDRSELEDGLD